MCAIWAAALLAGDIQAVDDCLNRKNVHIEGRSVHVMQSDGEVHVGYKGTELSLQHRFGVRRGRIGIQAGLRTLTCQAVHAFLGVAEGVEVQREGWRLGVEFFGCAVESVAPPAADAVLMGVGDIV